MGWLSGWSKRKSHNIIGQAGAGTNYQKRIKVHRSGIGPTSELAQLTLLNERTAKAFTIAAGSDWTEQDFGATVPTDTIVALCMLKTSTVNDLEFKRESGDSFQVGWAIGADTTHFDGAVFGIIPVKDKKTYSRNAGASGAVDVYVIGYFVESETTGVLFGDIQTSDQKIINGGTETAWTTVDLDAYINEVHTPIGAWIIFDCAFDQDVYFRSYGSGATGVLWEPDTSYPQRFWGFIPIDSDGKFEYKTGGNAINVWLAGIIYEVSSDLADRITFLNPEQYPLTANSLWNTITPSFSAKICTIIGVVSPSALNWFKVRKSGTSNVENGIYRPWCSLETLICPCTENSFEYYSNATGTPVAIYVGGIVFGYNLTDEVWLNDNCETDFGDIRFTDDDGTTELDYWIEDKVDSDYAIFWIEIADNLDSDQTIYIYYDKSGETTTSDGDATFRLFDHFDDESLDTDKWDTGGTGTTTETGTELTITSGSASANHRWVASDIIYAVGVAVECKVKVTTNGGYIWQGMTTTAGDSSGPKQTCALRRDPSLAYFTILSGDGVHADVSQWVIAKDLNYHRTSTRRTGTVDNFVLDSAAKSGLYPINTDRKVDFNAYSIGVATTIVVDWVAVRKYVSPEPINGSWGAEEVAVITVTKTYSIDMLFKKLNITTTNSIDILFQKLGITKTYDVDMLLKLGVTKFYLADLIIKRLNIEVPYDLDVIFKKEGIVDAYLLDVLFKKSGLIKDYVIDAIIARLGITKDTSIDVIFKKLGITKSYNIDVRFQKTTTETYDIDIMLQRQGLTKTELIDIILKRLGILTTEQIDVIFAKLGITKDYSMDIQFLITTSSTYDLDIILKRMGIEKSYLIDIEILKTEMRTYPIDVVFLTSKINPYLIDIIIIEKGELFYNLDVIFKKLDIPKSYLIDAIFTKIGIPLSVIIDTIIKKKDISPTYSIDILEKKFGLTKPYSLDTLLKRLNIQINYSIDMILGKLNVPVSYLINVIFSAVITTNYSIDIVLYEKLPTKQVSYLLDIILVAAILGIGGGQPDKIISPIPEIIIEYIDHKYTMLVKSLKLPLPSKNEISFEKLKIIIRQSYQIPICELNPIEKETKSVSIKQLSIVKKNSSLISISNIQISKLSILKVKIQPLEIFIKQETNETNISPLNIANEKDSDVLLSTLNVISNDSYLIPVMPLSTKKAKDARLKEILDIFDSLDELD